MVRKRLCWEDVSVTTQIPELTVRPDHMQVFMFSAATWNRHHIHYSKDAAVSEGLPDIVVQRGLIGNLLARLMTGWIGDSAELCKLSWKVTRSALPGKDIICRGRVRQKVESADKKYLVCKVTASDENDELIACGDAAVAFNPGQTPH
ncbi:MAG: hotdog family protein [Planctomycetota bacterium]|jgi:hydroxyacyl-ACP dehydratase HTD2-like protein with hotdog domain